ncbi:MAG TPA: D-alanine--D-alanine ligase [Bacillota bacterium]|jgi:D-alanine-D-alanine ligase|nr:D-alanine--D-alanine ligase [Bacillota bacterium]HPT68406.1 D-alanine--D-alanine ligase [Bacillota bacterium]
MGDKIRVGLIFGGRSGEHEVSVVSASSIMQALDPEKYQVLPIGITKTGRWLPGVSPQMLAAAGEREVKPGVEALAPAELRFPLGNPDGRLLGELADRVDVVFPVLHGPFGEDGTIQGLLELADLPYVGGGVLASALGMDKALMKMVFQQVKLPIADFLVVLRRDWEQTPEEILARIEDCLGYPCFIKPANLGSSVGISKARDREQLKAALTKAAAYDRKLVVEEFINGREIECSVLGNDDPIASVPGEIVPCAEFYDYEAKYILNDSKLLIPAELPATVTAEIREMAVRAFKAIDCAGLARVDFFVTREGNRVLVNEINTIPGFTNISMYPKMWEATGIPYKELLDRLIELAFERHSDRQRNRVS